MKRLIKNSDYYDQSSFSDSNNQFKEQIERNTIDICRHFGINENTLEINDSSREIEVNFGNIENDGYEVYISIYKKEKPEINRIIISCGKNSKGKSIYEETREQNILDEFISGSNNFIEWMQEVINNLELKFG